MTTMNLNQEYLEKIGVEYRGKILTECINLEKWIETNICWYLTSDPEKTVEIMNLLLDRLHFDGKIAIFEAIIKKQNTPIVFKSKYERLFKELRIVKDERNKFAHYIQDLNTNQTDGIVLLNFRNTQTPITYTESDFNKILQRVERCTIDVMDILNNVY